MRMSRYVAIASLLALVVPVAAQRQWIVYPSYYEGNMKQVASGDYDGGSYWYYDNIDAVARGYWDITADNAVPVAPNTDLFPVKPAMYAVEQWAPTVLPGGVTQWDWAAIEVTFDGPGSNEEGDLNLLIPWSGQYGTNHQWIGSELLSLSGVWKAAGPGPQAPADGSCSASGAVAGSLQMWMKRGSTLYTKWNFAWPFTAPITAVRLTEVYAPGDATCGTATYGGPVDLRCLGNADPLYALNEPFANDDQRRQDTTSIDSDHALAVESYTVWICLDPGFPFNVPLTPGLPADGLYTAHLADRDVDFRLRYNGLNTIKWKHDDTGEFDESAVFSLNGTPGQEFTPGNYGDLHFLTVSSGGMGHKLNVEAVYSDASTETFSINLYDWFGQEGDASNVTVGVNGVRKEAGGTGFRSVGKNGDSLESGHGGDASGGFLTAHRVTVDACKTLTQVNLSTDFMHAPDFVVESRAGGLNYTNFSTTGGWANDAAKSTVSDATPGIGCVRASAGAADTGASFAFTPAITGFYETQATWGKDLDASTEVAFVITSDDAPVTVFKNQRKDENSWRGLATVHLTAGNTYYVTVDASQSLNDHPNVYADAVRWHVPGITTHVLAATFETATCCPTPWADTDGDMDVDMVDFAEMQRCLTVGGGAILAGCECLDANGDTVVDSTDVVFFAECGLGPDVPFIHDATPPYWPNWPVGCPNQPAQ